MNRIVSITPVTQLVKPTYTSNRWNWLRKRYYEHPAILYRLADVSAKAIVE